MTDDMRTVPLHDEAMFTMKDNDCDDTIRELEKQCTNATQGALEGAKCEAQLQELLDWFDPDKTLFFVQFQTFSSSMYDSAVPMVELSAMELTEIVADEAGGSNCNLSNATVLRRDRTPPQIARDATAIH